MRCVSITVIKLDKSLICIRNRMLKSFFFQNISQTVNKHGYNLKWIAFWKVFKTKKTPTSVRIELITFRCLQTLCGYLLSHQASPNYLYLRPLFNFVSIQKKFSQNNIFYSNRLIKCRFEKCLNKTPHPNLTLLRIAW